MAAAEGFQIEGHAWSPHRKDIIDLLHRSRHAATRPIYYGSNHTFLVTLDGGSHGQSLAVYKPARGETPLYDFPTGTLYKREVATWQVNKILDWQVVPPTVVSGGQFGIGSLQLFIESHPLDAIDMEDLQRIAILDLLVNNADRKAEHCLPGSDGRVWGIDHGLTFHAQPKLRTVLWHFSGTSLPPKETADMRRLLEELRRPTTEASTSLSKMLSRLEFRTLEVRVRRLLESGRFPDPQYKAVPYRW